MRDSRRTCSFGGYLVYSGTNSSSERGFWISVLVAITLSLLVCLGARDDPLRVDAAGVDLGRAVVFSTDEDCADVDPGSK